MTCIDEVAAEPQPSACPFATSNRATQSVRSTEPAPTSDQYSLAKVFGIWIAATAPMGVLGWVIPPMIGDSWGMEVGLARAILLTIGLAWMTALSLGIVYREEGDLRWSTVKNRLRLQSPRHPKTGAASRRLWWWMIPIACVFGFEAMVLDGVIAQPLLDGPLSFMQQPAEYSIDEFAQDSSRTDPLKGAWWLFAIFVPLLAFNILGEELLFRGVLLPKMNGTFGSFAWVANGVLSTVYHVHQPSTIVLGVFVAPLVFALPAARFKSTTISMAVHGAQVPVILMLVLGIVLGVV